MAARSDKLHQRARRSFARKPAGKKTPRDRILIVCEGAVTEPLYFRALCRDIGLLNVTDVQICGEECDSAPSSVYTYALEALENDWKDTSSDDYDYVYCVFDKDSHACYQKTLTAIQKNPKHTAIVKDGKSKITKEANVIAIPSIPCFEFWALLHYEYTTAHLKNSAEVGKLLKKHIKNYKKDETKDLYPHLKDKTSDAIKNAEKALKAAKSASTDNPTTHIHNLVMALIKQSKNT